MGPIRRILAWLAPRTPLGVVRAAAVLYMERRAGHMAASLSFQTLVAFVPVSLFSVSLLRHLLPEDADAAVEEFLSTYLAPEIAERVTAGTIEIVRSANLAALGWVGALGMYLAGFLIIRNLKYCLNDLGFRSSKSRFWKRMGWVALVAFLVPLVGVIVAREAWVFARLPSVLSTLRPYVSTVMVVFLVYRFLPDRGPSTPSSLIASSIVGLLLEVEKIRVSYFLSPNKEVYAAIYGTLFFLPVLLGWLFLSWSLVLVGAGLAGALDDAKGLRGESRPPPRQGRA